MRINTNVSALNTQRILGQTNASVARSIGRLSSGFRINRAGDDAAGLGIANGLRADVRSMKQAARNAEQANSVLQIMEGAGQTLQGILERMKELATQAASDSVDSTGRTQINAEYAELEAEFTRIVDTTKFQDQALLKGGFGTTVSVDFSDAVTDSAGKITSASASDSAEAGTYTVSWATTNNQLTLTKGNESQTVVLSADGAQTVAFDGFGVSVEFDASFALADADDADMGDVVVSSSTNGGSFLVSASGDSSYASDKVTLDAVDLQAASLGTGVSGGGLTDIDLTSAANATTALQILDEAITDLSTGLGDIGAAQNRIDFATQNVKSAIENFAAAESTIRDVDMAAEMTEFTKQQILQQAGTAMLAQANAAPQIVLRLLQ